MQVSSMDFSRDLFVAGDYMTRFVRFATVLLIWGAFALPAAAQGLGVRAGASVDPDQFYFGGHLDTGPIADRLHFRPNVEIGLGDDVTLVAFNIEFAYFFPPAGGWSFSRSVTCGRI